ncbi:hypothetical protein HII31_13362 [Pseudocercospora fuligena]|uniref:Uncharacterized protein n=1 Tax=Pseudocercospora fuligena TaxID=685502 RepID=A0A8H6VAT4_9PEZI|nr:hypothetical protein HII31_13362 [Pseudocercospora fuligena]
MAWRWRGCTLSALMRHEKLSKDASSFAALRRTARTTFAHVEYVCIEKSNTGITETTAKMPSRRYRLDECTTITILHNQSSQVSSWRNSSNTVHHKGRTSRPKKT